MLVNEERVTDLEAVVAGPAGTPYAGGVFRVKLCFPRDFPASPPKGLFLTKVRVSLSGSAFDQRSSVRSSIRTWPSRPGRSA